MKYTFNLTLIIFLTFSIQMKAQNNSEIGINEIECLYSKNYTAPSRIEFVFSGNPKYINYFFSDLEKKIKKKFQKTKVEISFRYLDKQNHYHSKTKKKSKEFLLFLDINNSKVLDEKNGYNRLMKFKFNGKLVTKDKATSTLSFKSEVYAIHDINNKNIALADYIFTKLYLNK